MTDKSDQRIVKQHKKLIETIVTSFYERATSDIIIGYHFRKIQAYENPESHHALKPPMDAFKDHIPRIISFWELQLLGASTRRERPFQLIDIHRQLNILPGEVGRWMKLFYDVLTEKKEQLSGELADESIPTNHHLVKAQLELIDQWEKKLKKFHDIFMNSPKLFKHN